MSSHLSDGSTLDLSAKQRIDNVCTAFENALRSAEQPQIDTFLGNTPEPERLQLLLELLFLELDYLHRDGAQPDIEEYKSRFPNNSTVVAEAFERAEEAAKRRQIETTQTWPRRDDGAVTEPTRIDQYQIIGKLDGGGQAAVYRVADANLQKELVLKLSHHETAEGQEDDDKLLQEARILAELHHPNLGRVYSAGIYENRVYVVMDFIRGRNLQDYAKKGIDPREAAQIVAAIARAVDTAHRRNITHRDIKPTNIIIDETGYPILIDFGLAIQRQVWDDQSVTAQKVISGTVPYMPPEQARGEVDKVDARSDTFSLGAVLYWLLTGKAPFPSDDLNVALDLAAHCEFDKSALDAAPRKLKNICLRAMQADPAERFQSAKELGDELRRYEHSITRRPLMIAVPTAVVFLLGAGLGLWQLFSDGESTPSASGDGEGTPSANGDVDFQVAVQRDGKIFYDLNSVIPLRSGDGVQVICQAPASHHVGLFWYDAQGELHTLKFVKDESAATDSQRARGDRIRWVWPAPDSFNVQEGIEGTEVVFVCGSADQPPPADVQRYFDNGPWPSLDGFSWLQFDRQGVTPHKSRAPSNKVRVQQDEVRQRAENLQRELTNEFDVIKGIAFPYGNP